MKMPSLYRIQHGAATIEYALVLSKRKTLGIHVYPDCRVIVRAPLGSDPRTVEAHVRTRAAWILKHVTRFQTAPPVTAAPETPRYADGATIRYLGTSYPLRVEAAARDRVQRVGGEIVVAVKGAADADRAAALVKRWLRLQAERVFAERLTALFPRVESWGVAFPPLKIRDMRSRWGSCSSKGNVSLNLRLIHQPLDLIDYVVLHELCHLKELNHSPRFWALMDRVLPDWRERRKQLNRRGEP